ncbi:MAG: RbsD/FucU family protein [Granulosicoccus sp.]
MLKNINSLLNADILYALAAMGHGDSIVLCDSNFPAHSVASGTTLGRVLRADGANVTQLAQAVLSLMPLDTFVDDAAICMEVVDAPEERPDVQIEVQGVIDASESVPFKLVPVERFAFYERAKQSFAVISSGERRFYGCFILTKGVIAPAE